MKARFVLAGLVVALAAATAAPVHAQVFTPSYLAPTRGSDFGVYLEDGFPGADDIALEALLRRSFGTYDLGFRAGVADQGDDLAILLGGDYRNPLELSTAPVQLAVTGAVQAIVGDFDAVGADVGLSIGATFAAPQFSITPYVHPRIGLINSLDVDEDLDLDLLADVGFDLAFSRNLIVRLGVGLSDEVTDFGIGLAWR